MARSRQGAHFHETPLVLFSALAVAGAGVGGAHLLSGFLGGGWALDDPRALLMVGLLVLGGVISGGHLGRPLRGPLALRGLGRSPLSNEVLALGLAAVFPTLSLLLPWGPWTGVLGFLASFSAVLLLLALGGVYVLPGQVAWRGLAATSPLIMGLTWGLVLDQGMAGGIRVGSGAFLWLALLLDTLVVLGRWRGLERTVSGAEISHPRAFRLRGLLLGLRLLLSMVVTPAALLMGFWISALGVFTLALLVDRLGFYALALRQTTESEVRRVESILA